MKKNAWISLLYRIRDLRSSVLFRELCSSSLGEVLDVGGWDFFLSAKRQRVSFSRWTTLDRSRSPDLPVKDRTFRFIKGDGTRIQAKDGSFDTVLNIQVLEHTADPLVMMKEMTRVLKPGGRLIMLVPCTADLHFAPLHYYNFTRYWCETAVKRNGLSLVKLVPLGGVWSTIASKMFYFFLHAFRIRGFSSPAHKRGILFPFLFPFMVLWAVLSVPVCLVLSLGDLSEEPNNHFVVAIKKRGERGPDA